MKQIREKENTVAPCVIDGKNRIRVDGSPTVTVCLPVYNASAYLRECIDSILGQTFPDFELLIVDDGSTDESADIVRSYADPRIRFFMRSHDYIGSLNFLLAESRGKYIARMDADDVMMPDRLKMQFEYMEEHPDVDILGGGAHCFGDENLTVTPFHDGPMRLEMFMRGCALMHPTVMMRRSSVEKHHLRYDREFIYAEDYQLWVRALEVGLYVTNIEHPVIRYRVSPSQISSVHREAQKKAAQKVQRGITQWQMRNEAEWALPKPYRLPDSSNRLTVIIPFLNEKEEVERTVRSIRETVGSAVDILVINDASYDGYPYGKQLSPHGVCYVLNSERQGVAASRDMGVRLCRTPYFLLLDAHMRFYDNKWAERIVSELEADDRQLLCCQTKFLYKEPGKTEVSVQEKCPLTYGAYCPFGPKSVWPDIEWNLKEFHPGSNKEDIAVVLGAGYAASKRYWTYLHGLERLRNYGSDEAYISFKVWLEGGRCVLLKDVVIGHIYRNSAPYIIQNKETVYNQLLIARLLFPQSLYCRAWVRAVRQHGALVAEVSQDFARHKTSLRRLRSYYRSIFTRGVYDILPLHVSRHGIEAVTADAVGELLHRLPDIYERSQQVAPVGDGLYEGRAGRILWLCHYSRHTGEASYEEQAAGMWAEMEQAVFQHRLPWGFRYGLSGVGWCALHLWLNGMLDDYPAELIAEIDRQLALLLPDADGDLGFETGLSGVFPYLCLRLCVGQPDWPASLVRKWCRLASRVQNGVCDETALYYARFFQTLQKAGCEMADRYAFHPDWVTATLFLPANSEFWDFSLADRVPRPSLNVLLICASNASITDNHEIQ